MNEVIALSMQVLLCLVSHLTWFHDASLGDHLRFVVAHRVFQTHSDSRAQREPDCPFARPLTARYRNRSLRDTP